MGISPPEIWTIRKVAVPPATISRVTKFLGAIKRRVLRFLAIGELVAVGHKKRENKKSMYTLAYITSSVLMFGLVLAI